MNKQIVHAEWLDNMCCYRLYDPEPPHGTIGFEGEETISKCDKYDITIRWSHEEDILNRLALTCETMDNAKKKLEVYPYSKMYKEILNRAIETERLLQKELDECHKIKGEM